ncbi:MAG: hypothetical protein KC729_21540, partial [Candidatus Eisenbacteria bacterium]|nr:hypothetical protein [Candidatus Eisenbacteria bacterium]
MPVSNEPHSIEPSTFGPATGPAHPLPASFAGKVWLSPPEVGMMHAARGWQGRVLSAVAGLALLATGPALAHEWTYENASPRAAEAPTGDPENRCELSRISLRSDDAVVALSADAADRLLDDDATTGVELAAGSAIEIEFVGAPRWVNHVAVDGIASGDAAFDVDVLVDGTWIPFAAPAAPVVDGSYEAAGSDSHVQGVRVRLASAVPTTVGTVRATFEQIDPDFGAAQSSAAGAPILHYDWVNYYPDATDLKKCDNDARGLRDHLPGSWDWGGHGNNNSHEHHYKRGDVGSGCNESHLDWADLSYFSGHGGKGWSDWYYDRDLGAFLFGALVDDKPLVPGDARAAWGNNNCEWHAMTSCKTLESGSWDEWALAMSGLHLILG